MNDCDIYIDEQLEYAYTSEDMRYIDELWFIDDVSEGRVR